MSTPVAFFLLAGVLVLVGAVLREFEVPGVGSIGRGRIGWMISAGIVVTTVGAAGFTLQRLVAMAL